MQDVLERRMRQRRKILFDKDDELFDLLRLKIDDAAHTDLILWSFRLVKEKIDELEDDIYLYERYHIVKDWTSGKIKMKEAKAAILEIHGLAKKIDDPYLIASYHAIAQALSVVHTRGHAMGFVLYDLTSKIRRFGIDMKTLEESVDHYLTLLDEVKVDRSERKWATFIVSLF